ncbi:hypothetical protein NQ314_010183 [Rhamnusium bicolor]|uniref:Uncharacterized protein n=1 Tax=Rhamnusium bicolor TaxID=1586634 RepID=A0AAV8XSD0_9CUCU|nr:hypothetical protein NQ314_010183 [Rhamnusium bicolor]
MLRICSKTITLPNKIPRLRKGCMPVPFSKPRNLEVDETEYDTKFDMTLTDTKIMPEFIQPKFIKPESINIVNDANLKNPFKMEEFTDLIGIKEETNAAHSNFFNELFENKYIFDLTEYWGIHSCESWMPPQRPCMVFLVDKRKPKTIIFLQVNTREGFPVFEKHVVINEQLEIRYFVGHTMVYNMCLPQLCSTLEELCNAVNKYSEFVLCRGGPSCEEYKEIIHITNCAYQDVSSRAWRHKNCNFFTQGNMQPCLFCQALPKYFKTILKKIEKIKKLKRKNGI